MTVGELREFLAGRRLLPLIQKFNGFSYQTTFGDLASVVAHDALREPYPPIPA